MGFHVANRCDYLVEQSIDGKYTVLKVLGEGAFGKVYKVCRLGGNRDEVFALKLLKLWEVPENIRQGLIDRFDMEFQTGRIQSNYLVHSLDYGFVEGNPYIVMEFCSGGDLSQFLKSSGTNHRPPKQLHQFSMHILVGLNDLHQSGKVHRDLKPENVLLKTNDWAVLTDFGICGDRNKRMTERNILGKPSQIFGTYAYMPPEQARRERGDATVLPTTDIFSFGVMLYQLLVGELPFGELSNHNDLILYQKNAAQGFWNRNKLSGLHNENNWKNILEACLVPDYRQRIQRVSDIIKMLPNGTQFQPQQVFESNGNRILLRVMQGEEYGKVYPLSEMVKQFGMLLPAGRDSSNPLSIQELTSCYISRRHCTLEYERTTNRWFIRDGQWIPSKNQNLPGCWNRSTNGTYVNSTEVSEEGMEFRSGDIISIGDVKLRVENYQ